MGLFFRKKLKDINLEQDIDLYLVFPYKTQKNLVWINHKATIPENAELAFGYKGKVLDILPKGEFKLTAVTLPICSKKFRLAKPDKYNNIPDRFPCNVYYVSKGMKEKFEFSTKKRMRFRNIRDGKFWVGIDFYIDFQIQDVQKFMKKQLKVYSYLKYGEAEEIFANKLEKYLTKEIIRENYLLSSFEEHKEELLEILKLKTNKYLEDWGVQLVDLNFKNINISKNAGKNPNKFEKPNVWKGLECLTKEENIDKINEGE